MIGTWDSNNPLQQRIYIIEKNMSKIPNMFLFREEDIAKKNNRQIDHDIQNEIDIDRNI